MQVHTYFITVCTFLKKHTVASTYEIVSRNIQRETRYTYRHMYGHNTSAYFHHILYRIYVHIQDFFIHLNNDDPNLVYSSGGEGRICPPIS